ncbi:MAG: thioredoxin-like domain-containing protein [Bacteroidales bacterium]
MKKNLCSRAPFSLYLITILFLVITGCGSNNDGFRTVIKGEFPDFAGKMVTLSEIDIYQAIPVDTTNIKSDGSFRFSFNRTEAGFYLIKVDNRNYLTLVLDQENRIDVYSGGKELRPHYRVEGSPDSELYRQFELFHENNRKKIDSLSMVFKNYQRSSRFLAMKMELDENYIAIFDSQREYMINFLENNCQSLASLLIINRRFGQRLVINENDDFDYFKRVDSCLSVRYPNNKHLAELKSRITKAEEKRKINELLEEKLAPGNKAPDITLETPGGKPASLYEQAGLPVIVYFWASWDKNSREFNDQLKNAINRIGSSKIRVFAIGFESYKETWQNIIELDGIQNWTHVTDYLNIRSSSKSLFNVPDDLPYLFLLDKDMVIRYKGNNLRDLIDNFNRLDQ